MTPADLARLCCPETGQPLRFEGTLDPAGHLARGQLIPAGGGAPWPVVDGLPRLYRETRLHRSDRFMRRFYDGLPRAHDPAVRLLLPALQGPGETEDQLRDFYLARLDLAALPRDRPARILETSVGTGANLPRLRAHLPRDVDLELWGLDLSAGMLARLRRNGRAQDTRLVMGDAHQLPFPAATFDRVFHVGGINGFGDRARALAEMGRVARPGTPIVVCDEQLDPGRPHGLLRRLAFRAITFYDAAPCAPTDQLPPGAQILEAAQPSRFFYSLTWAVPAPVGAHSG